MSDNTEKIVELLDVHGGRLHGMLAKLTANRCAADELLQELFLRLLKSQALSAAQSPEAYLFRSAINLAFDWRKRQHHLPEVPFLDRDVPAEESSPIDQMIVDETTKRVLEAKSHPGLAVSNPPVPQLAGGVASLNWQPPAVGGAIDSDRAAPELRPEPD